MKLLNVRAVADKLALSTSSVWKLCKKDPTFPVRRTLVGNRACWVEAELDDWLEEKFGKVEETKDAA